MESFVGFLLAVGAVSAFLFWFAKQANQTRDKNQELVQQYLLKMREVHQLKEQTHRYTMPRWPIWPRPVLYESIDLDTQRTFAQMLQSIAVAQGELCHVQPIREDNRAVIRFDKHVAALLKYNENLARWETLQQAIQSVREHLGRVEANLRKVVAAQGEVEAGVAELKKEVGENMQKLPNIQKMRGQAEFEIIQKQIENAQYFMAQAEKSLSLHNSEDGIEYARAHLCCRGSKVMIDSFRAGFVQFSYPANVELDETSKLTEWLNNFVLNDIPAISNQGWKSLMQVNQFLLKAEGILKQIRASLKEFETKYAKFRERVKSLESIKYEDQINNAIDEEMKLSEYWGTIEQSPAIWEQVLGETQRPSEGLVSLQNKLRREVGPMLRPENIIKQSHMDYILNKLDEVLKEFKHLESVVQRIRKHTREQKDAQEQVFRKVGDGGEARIVINQLTVIRDDTTPALNREISEAIDRFNQVCDRAENSVGANYPQLLTELALFMADCKKLKEKHQREVGLLENEATAFSRQLRTLYDKISGLSQRTPHADINLDPLHAIFKDTNAEYQAAGSSYSALGAYIKRSKDIVIEFERAIRAMEEQFQQYEQFKREIKKEIKSKQDEILKFMTKIGLHWAKPLHENQKKLSEFSNNLLDLLVELENADRLPSMAKAIKHCEGVRGKLNSYAKSVATQIKKIENELDTLLGKDHELQEMFNHAFDLKLKELPNARNIREQAKDQTSFQNAYMFLNRAITMLQTGGDTIIKDNIGTQINMAGGNISDVTYISNSNDFTGEKP